VLIKILPFIWSYCVIHYYVFACSVPAQETMLQVIRQSKRGAVTLLYGARDPHINHAVVLQAYLQEKGAAI